ncbi:cytochrome-c oxidase, cbb3-type subunit III [Paracoccus spongiarum]|uniref:Cbb3-type cytochrome c oxidase subunit n=1 Tax=Paracoccus spongiarum TaxID=3064387 RepID=A0ABT9JAK2_9RHOB|nr:cytochrome-c oxidase, cbb3-type subunit III [Paracoccus sp. 2205BS29-5]MDP5306836.1 cytochrome-c oxidase, cbb3-type subunit III [Paracoccus sp. 2205BS29-5]
MAEDKDKPETGAPGEDDRIGLERQAADSEHAAKLAGDIPPRTAPDRPAAPKKRARGRHGVIAHEVPSTGHEWDGITEYDNPMPRWWLWTFYATIVWAVFYVIAYPAIPLVNGATRGLLGTTNRQQVAAEIERFDQANAAIQTRLASVELSEIPNDPELVNYATNAGGAVFRTWCAQCHGSGAAGARGYPNLLDNDWLWGGTLEDIHLTLQHGIRDPNDPDTRYSEMPRFGRDGLLERPQIQQVVDYVLSLSDLPHDAASAAEGAVVYAENCAACHAEDGSGDRTQGAPNLADAVWLYGSEPETLNRIITEGPYGVMPAWASRLDEADIRAVSTYVHGLGGGE